MLASTGLLEQILGKFPIINSVTKLTLVSSATALGSVTTSLSKFDPLPNRVTKTKKSFDGSSLVFYYRDNTGKEVIQYMSFYHSEVAAA
jgi:hypothetical protein